MRNICLSDFDSQQLCGLSDCQVICHNHQYLFACDKNLVIKSSGKSQKIICNLIENLYPVTSNDDIPEVLDITYCSEKNLLYLILINGDIISLEEDGKGSETIIGTVDDGIKAARWNPEQEIMALVTGNDTVIVMTKEFDPVSEVNLHGGGFGEKQFITVGWGKKETQFRGSEGKFSEKKKEESNEGVIKKSDKIKISWRGDSSYFVVSSINPESSQRYLRIFNKSGVLQYTSEDLNGLDNCLYWRPSGNLIASAQRLPNKYIVCFFEKNGLKHGEFTLPLDFNEIKVDEIQWNLDSKILALLITGISETFNGKFIHLYTVNNYHWYWKYSIDFDADSTPILMCWDQQKTNSLHVIIKKEEKVYHNKYSWLWTTNKSKGTNNKDGSFVAVIDGNHLLLTSFKKGIIPPPLCSYSLHMEKAINSVTFISTDDESEECSSNDFVVELSDGNLLIYKFDNQSAETLQHKLVGKIIGLNKSLELHYNFQWLKKNILMVAAVKINGDESKPFLKRIEIEKFETELKYKTIEIPLESTIAIMRPSNSGVVIYQNNGQIYFFNNTSKEINNMNQNNSRTLIECEVKENKKGDFFIFSLDNLNKFYINNKSILSGVLSFHIHGEFILLTTLKQSLLCLNIEEDMTNLNDLSEIFLRKIERGSRIVTSVDKDLKVVLQMPRGNLECVQPRALSLFILGQHLNSLNYYEAFDIMRKQRINLNLLYDHNPRIFSKNINEFIKQIKDIQWLSLFISELNEEDVTKTMYSFMYKGKGNSNEEEGKSKIKLICDLVEKELIQKDEDKYILPILTCYIKRNDVQYLEKALLKLKNLKEKELRGLQPMVSFNEAFKYLLYLIDVEELYKIALGMYDFDLVLLVAAKSQKDPKEYLSFLNELKQLEPSYQKYTIDKYLKRYKKALTNLVLCDGDDVFNECLNFIKAHSLYKFALKLIPPNTDRYKNVCICYGEDLMESGAYEEAGIMFATAGMFRHAMEAYQKSGNWREVILCAGELTLNEMELSEVYLNLAMELADLKLFKESSIIFLDYLNDVEECIRTLSKGKHYAEAYRICHLRKRSDLINLIIVPEILEQCNVLKLQISNFRETFVRQKDRLLVVRKQKQEATDNKVQFDDDDLISETNTIVTQSNAASRTTNRTYRSAKNRRKQERKLLSLKEGSPYEDLALITSLYNVVTNCIDLKLEVNELNKFLIKIRKNEMAEKLQNELDDCLKLIEHYKTEIWTPDLLNNKQSYEPEPAPSKTTPQCMRWENTAPVLLNPKFAIPPEIQIHNKWQFEILKP